jgi:hypothetical protein
MEFVASAWLGSIIMPQKRPVKNVSPVAYLVRILFPVHLVYPIMRSIQSSKSVSLYVVPIKPSLTTYANVLQKLSGSMASAPNVPPTNFMTSLLKLVANAQPTA